MGPILEHSSIAASVKPQSSHPTSIDSTNAGSSSNAPAHSPASSPSESFLGCGELHKENAAAFIAIGEAVPVHSTKEQDFKPRARLEPEHGTADDSASEEGDEEHWQLDEAADCLENPKLSEQLTATKDAITLADIFLRAREHNFHVPSSYPREDHGTNSGALSEHMLRF
ncbi:hypothetical protein BJ875DRAFT_485347 [Amylocarpus encephaloides]|uniref:Uncharacterized protein n=1 Tax=Amylocarpus encephaloides TaxID=45428 RepID=A0A9P7YHE1_9HELO|nr:hypothetical protein BJ875DRAFT_485347 [Amylocarpus encephaloides]